MAKNFPYDTSLIDDENTITRIEPITDDFIIIEWNIKGHKQGYAMHKRAILQAIFEFFNNHSTKDSQEKTVTYFREIGLLRP